jgi:hypothetical protein
VKPAAFAALLRCDSFLRRLARVRLRRILRLIGAPSRPAMALIFQTRADHARLRNIRCAVID